MKFFPHQKKLESRWWHRAAQVFYYGVSAIWVSAIIFGFFVFLFDSAANFYDFLAVAGGWVIFSVICYALYWRGIVYVVYGTDK